MDNTMDTKIPYSSEAVKKLFYIERNHVNWFYPNRREGYTKGCRICLWDPSSSENRYPCPTLMEARKSASKETLIAVALLLSGEKS